MTASLACVTLSRIWRASANCSVRSVSVTAGVFGLREMVNDCVCVSPAAVRRTWYVPGGAIGPRVLPAQRIMPGKSFAFA